MFRRGPFALRPGRLPGWGFGRGGTHTARVAIQGLPDGQAPAEVTHGEGDVGISIVIPVFNEGDNVRPLLTALEASLSQLGTSYEVIVVDDGSTDATYARLEGEAAKNPRLRVIRLRRNYGQTAAMAAGFDHARGSVIIPIDGDLQNEFVRTTGPDQASVCIDRLYVDATPAIVVEHPADGVEIGRLRADVHIAARTDVLERTPQHDIFEVLSVGNHKNSR